MSNTIQLATRSLKDHEGLRLKPYQCTQGRTTIGYGRNLDDRGISEGEAIRMLERDVLECIRDLEGFDYWRSLTPRQQAALVDLRFCVGAAGYRGFKKMNAALEVGDISEAAAQIKDSLFASQTGRRADNLVAMLVG